jgi:Mg-chelatase subunit ChlD
MRRTSNNIGSAGTKARVTTLAVTFLFAFVTLIPAGIAADPQSQVKSQPQVKSHLEEVPVEESHPDATPAQSLKPGDRLSGEVHQNQATGVMLQKLGMLVKDGTSGKVEKVADGSPVAKRGVVAGDTLVSQTSNPDGSVTLTMEHAGQGFRFTVGAAELAASTAKFDIPVTANNLNGKTDTTQLSSRTGLLNADTTHLNGGANQLKSGGTRLQSQLQDPRKRSYKSIVDVLENHDLGLIVDRSGSMSTRDCPGGLSRWDWCCQEATQLAEAASQASSSIDASIFNVSYLTYKHISPAQIPQIFATNQPAGGTEPAYALMEQMEDYFNSKRAKPLTIVIVTDGLPNNCRNIAQVLQDESKKIKYQGEITITFLLIGTEVDDVRLRSMIGLAPNSTVKNGGFVDIVNFSELEGKGIRQALFEDLKEARLCTDPSKASKAYGTALGPAAAMNGLYPSSAARNYPNNGITNYGSGGRNMYSPRGLRNYPGSPYTP